MAGIKGALTPLLIGLLLAVPAPDDAQALPAVADVQSTGWYQPVLLQGKSFPVLLSASGRWLNWRDTYGAPRMRQGSDGVWRQTGTHQGIDIFAEQGTPVVAIVPGVVENAGWTFYSGFRVGIRDTDGRYWFYAHLLKELSVAQGTRVLAGQVLGTLGSSGYGPEGTSDEFPPHLHLGLQARGRWQNPESMLRELYAHTTSQLRGQMAESQRIADHVRLLRSRAYLSGAPVDLIAGSVTARLEARKVLAESTIYR